MSSLAKLLLTTTTIVSSHIPQPQSIGTHHHHTQTPIGLKQKCDGLRTCTVKTYGKYKLHSNTTIESDAYKINFLPSKTDKLRFDKTRDSGVYFHYTRSPNEMTEILNQIHRHPSTDKILDFNELLVLSIRNQIPSETVKLTNSYELYELRSPETTVLIMNFRKIEWYNPDLSDFMRISNLNSDCDISNLLLPNHLRKLFKPPNFTSVALSINSKCSGFSVVNDPTEITCGTTRCDYLRYISANFTKTTSDFVQSRELQSNSACYDSELQLVTPKCLLKQDNSKKLSRNLDTSCENDQICSSNSRGYCDSGKCVCYAGWTGDRCQIMINYCDEKKCNDKFTKQCDIEPIEFTFKLAFTNLPDMDPWGGMDIYCKIKDGDGYYENTRDGSSLGLTMTVTSGQQENWVDVDDWGYGQGKRLIMADRYFGDYISLPKPLRICCFDEDWMHDDSIGCINIDHKRLESNINNGSIWQDYSNFENPEKEHEAKLQILETLTGTKSDCTCKPGYHGDTCDAPDDFCENNECVLENTVACVEQKSLQKYICECKPGYAGNFCEIEKNECSSMPCENGGTCIDKGVDEYECECLFGYTGTDCLEADNFCNSSPCQNGAICKQYIGRYVCGCIDGWLGLNCDKERDYCQGSTNKCANGGICESNSESQSFTCQCGTDFTGETCEKRIYSCSHCVNHEDCIYGNCICLPGFTGKSCEIDIDECELPVQGEHDKWCLNGSKCIDKTNKFECDCAFGFTGKRCETKLLSCDSEPCTQNGLCKENGMLEWYCECNLGFDGIDCGHSTHDCDQDGQNYCKNGGDCLRVTILDSYCVCQNGWTGKTCELTTEFCDSTPCQNGGKCEILVNSENEVEFFCNCEGTGFTGLECSDNIDDCVEKQCSENSNCIDLVNSAECSCFEDFTGEYCEVRIDKCVSNPCGGNGICIPQLGLSFTCECLPGYKGVNCDIAEFTCDSKFCKNGGTCVELNSGEFICNCDVGFTGKICELDKDLLQLCVHSTCDEKGTFKCDTKDLVAEFIHYLRILVATLLGDFICNLIF